MGQRNGQLCEPVVMGQMFGHNLETPIIWKLLDQGFTFKHTFLNYQLQGNKIFW